MPITSRRSPFSPEIQPGSVFASESHKEGLRRLNYLVENRGIGVVTGDVGVGKSTLVRAFTSRLAAGSFTVLYTIPPAPRSPLRPLVEDLLTQLGEPLPFNNAAKGLQLLKAALAACYDRNRQPCIIVDDAPLLDPKGLSMFKVLANYEMDSKLPLSLLLVGSPQLLRLLAMRELEDIRQRLLFAYQLRGLRKEEVEDYIKTRLKAAGQEAALFPRDVIDDLYFHTQGNPRAINQLASLCLMAAAAERKDLVDRNCLSQAVAEVNATRLSNPAESQSE
jgi:type II secretory pathway predicted ATPase ExeA